MDTREWQNLQEALVWVYYPLWQLGLGLWLGASILTAINWMFARLGRWLTRPPGVKTD